MRDLTWYQYFFTECRVIWDYVRLFFIPAGQNLDPEISISRNILAHGAVIGLAGLLIASVLAWTYRRRFPLASYGWFVWLILLAPTSSLVPIRDPMAERRMYPVSYTHLDVYKRQQDRPQYHHRGKIVVLHLPRPAGSVHQRPEV